MLGRTMTQAAERPRSMLLSSEFMARLDQLDVMSRKILSGKMKGERRSKRRGQSVEFADFRNYVIGDDLRFIDWNIYARLEKLFLKLFLEEEDLAVYVLVDISRSVDYGEPNKALYIKQVAAALGYIGLVNYNRVTIAAMSDGIVAETGAMRGRRNVARMIDFVDRLEPTGASHFADACKRFALMNRQKGVLIVQVAATFSACFEPSDSAAISLRGHIAVSRSKKLTTNATTVAQNTDISGEKPQTMKPMIATSDRKWNQKRRASCQAVACSCNSADPLEWYLRESISTIRNSDR